MAVFVPATPETSALPEKWGKFQFFTAKTEAGGRLVTPGCSLGGEAHSSPIPGVVFPLLECRLSFCPVFLGRKAPQGGSPHFSRGFLGAVGGEWVPRGADLMPPPMQGCSRSASVSPNLKEPGGG